MPKAIIEITTDNKGAITGLKEVQQKMEQTKDTLEKGGKSVDGFFGKLKSGAGSSVIELAKMSAAMIGITSVANTLGKAIGYNIKTAKEFERSMSQLRSLTGLVGKDLEYMKEQAIRLGSSTTQSASQVVEAMKLIGSQKPELLKSKEALTEVTAQAITLAEAAVMDVPDAATALTSALNQMGAGADKAGEYINIMAAASQQGAGDINYLNQAITNSGATAKMAEIPFNELVASIEAVASGGYDASTAGTSLRNIFLRLEKQTNDKFKPSVVGLSQALENLSKANLDTTAKAKLFGATNISVAGTLLDQRKAFDALKEGITGTSTAYDQAKINTDNFYGSVENLKSAWEGLNLKINESNGFLKKFIDLLTEGVNILAGNGSKDKFYTEIFQQTADYAANYVEGNGNMTESQKESRSIYHPKGFASLQEQKDYVKAELDKEYQDMVSKIERMYPNDAVKRGQEVIDAYNNYLKVLNKVYERLENPSQTAAPLGSTTNGNGDNPNEDLLTEQQKIQAKKDAQALKDLDERLERERRRSKEDIIAQTNQAVINAEKEGRKKLLMQIAQDYLTEKTAIQREEEDLLAQKEANARALWEAQHAKEVREGLTWSNSGAQAQFRSSDASKLTKEEEDYFNARRQANESSSQQQVDALNKKLLESYQDYDAKRREIDKKYSEDREQLMSLQTELWAKLGSGQLSEKEQGKIQEQLSQVRSAINQSLTQEAKDRMTLGLEQLKENPEFIQAFEDVESVATTTLEHLYAELEKLQLGLTNLDPKNLKEILKLKKSIEDEKTARKTPFERYKVALDELREAEEKQDSDAIVKAQEKIQKAYKESCNEVETLAQAIQGIGAAIGGEAGEIISLMGDILSFATNSMQSIQTLTSATATAISTVEKASVILAIVSAAIQIFQKLNEVLKKFSAESKHDALVKKQKAINDLADSVNNYRLAVMKAEQEEANWYGSSRLDSLAGLAKVQEQAYKGYQDKINQTQVKYKGKKAGGWFNDLMSLPDTLLQWGNQAIWGEKVGNVLAWMVNPVGMALSTTIFGQDYTPSDSYAKAIDNLRIETRKKSRGFLGSGIGGHSQKTEDLRTWAKQNYGNDLFDADGWINGTLAQQIIDSYGDKLQGETKETLEQLISLKEQYDEYMKSLKEYVANLYEPLIDNMLDGIWAMFDDGKDALGAFKEEAGKTFRDIVSDMLRTIVLSKIFDGFEDDITKLYNAHLGGNISQEQLLKGIAERTNVLMNSYESQIPTLQNILDTMNGILGENGISLKNASDKAAVSASVGASNSFTEEQAAEIVGHATAIRMAFEGFINTIGTSIAQLAVLSTLAQSGSDTMSEVRNLMIINNSYLEDIAKYAKLSTETLVDKLTRIADNTDKL